MESKRFTISIPKTLAAKIDKSMRIRKCSLDDVVFFEVEKVCSPSDAHRSK